MRRANASEAAEEEVADDRRHVGMGQLAVRLQPREHPVHHAEQQHRQRLVEAGATQIGPSCGDGIGEHGDDPALAVQHAPSLFGSHELDVFGENAVLVLRARVDGEESRDERAQSRFRALPIRFGRLNERQ